MGSLLHALKVPPDRGDTAFANTYKAYEALDPETRERIEGKLGRFSRTERHNHNYPNLPALTEVEKAGRPDVWHPVTRTHPETGRTALFVNGNFTTAIDGLAPAESDAMLAMLLAHIGSPQWQCRHRWTEGDLTMWDNRAVQHFAVPDYTSRRIMHRLTIAGDEPKGPAS